MAACPYKDSGAELHSFSWASRWQYDMCIVKKKKKKETYRIQNNFEIKTCQSQLQMYSLKTLTDRCSFSIVLVLST